MMTVGLQFIEACACTVLGSHYTLEKKVTPPIVIV